MVNYDVPIRARLRSSGCWSVLLSAVVLMLSAVSTKVEADSDPTAPLGWQRPATQAAKSKLNQVHPRPRLQSIVCAEGSDCYAVVNNQLVALGDSVAGYKITEITPEGMRVARAGKEWTLSLFSMQLK